MSFAKVTSFFNQGGTMANPAVEEQGPRRKLSTNGDVVFHLSSEGEVVYFTQPLQFRLPPPPEPTVNPNPQLSPRSTSTNTNSGYWTVRTLTSRTGSNKDCSTISDMDTTSVIAFRDSDGNKGASTTKAERESSSPALGKASASKEYREGTFVEDNVLVPYDSPITIFTNYGVGGR